MREGKFDASKELILETVRLFLFWALFSVATLGLATGAALSSMYKGLFKMFKGKDRTPTSLRRFKKDTLFILSQSLKAMVILGGLGFAAYTLLTLKDVSFFIRLGGGFLAFETVLVGTYIFPALAVFKFPTTLHVFMTSLLMSHFHVMTTLKIAGVFVIAFIGAIELTLYLLPLSIILYVFLSAKALHPTFMHYVNRIQDAQSEDSDEEAAALSSKGEDRK